MGSFSFDDMLVTTPGLLDSRPAFADPQDTSAGQYHEFGGFSPATSPVKDLGFKAAGAALSGDDLNRWAGLTEAPYPQLYNQKFNMAPTSIGKPYAITANAISQFGQVTPPKDESSPNDLDAPSELSAPLKTSGSVRRTGGFEAVNDTSILKEAGSTTHQRRKATSRKSNRKSSTASTNASESTDDKRSKFLERNRVAASKCRQKKKEWTENLEAKHREQQSLRRMLVEQRDSARQEVLMLKDMILTHSDCYHPAMESWLANSATRLGDASAHRMPMKSESMSPEGPSLDYEMDQDSPWSEGSLRGSDADMDMVESALMHNLGDGRAT